MNTGRKKYNTLVQINADTAVATGVTKANTIGDPDYVPPVIDTVSCPVPPAPPVPVQNKIRIDFKNLTNQFIYLNNVVIAPQNVAGNYYNNVYGSYPGQVITGAYVNQLDEFFKLSFNTIALSKNTNVTITIRYISSAMNVVVQTTVVNIGDVRSFINLISTTVPGGGNNVIEVTFN